TDDGVDVEWWAETDVFGRIAQMGQRVINPVANRVINQFFGKVEAQLTDVSQTSGLRDRIKGMF
ncbi:MAG: SRPBCC domain-containing protein, partial [Natronomonas sp.]